MAEVALPLAKFSHGGREKHSIAAELEGGLLISRNPFPYFMLVALEAGGPLRCLLLLLLYPFIWVLDSFISQGMALGVATFVSTAGLKLSDVEAVARSCLTKFYLEDVGKEAYAAFTSCGGHKYVLTSIPAVMVEPFLREYMGVDHVVGAQLRTTNGGRCLGLAPGIRRDAMMSRNVQMIDVGLCGRGVLKRPHPFISLCREMYLSPEEGATEPLPRSFYPKPLIFHDGRLVSRPTPLNALLLLLWLPLGASLALVRIMIGILLPYGSSYLAAAATGFRFQADIDDATRGRNAVMPKPKGSRGTMYVCSHRTLLDPLMVSSALGRRTAAVAFSISRLSEVLSPIPTFRLTRERSRDSETMRSLLEHRDLVVFPEGTTCREPYLLRFSALFAEVAENIVPVAVSVEGITMFYGTSMRGYKSLDSFFFLMNPTPCYRLHFLDKLVRPTDRFGCSIDVANHVQRLIGDTLGFRCTNFTRSYKYRMIAGNDGMQPTIATLR